MNNSISRIVSRAFPITATGSITYNAEQNVFLTAGYTSAAGNMYYGAIRLSEHLVVRYDIGQGYAHTFLNGITLMCWNGNKPMVIAQKYWGGGNWRIFSEEFAREESIKMLTDYLFGQAKILGESVNQDQIRSFSESVINETRCKQIA